MKFDEYACNNEWIGVIVTYQNQCASLARISGHFYRNPLLLVVISLVSLVRNKQNCHLDEEFTLK